MAKQSVLDVLRLQRLPQQGVVLQINHPHREVVRGTPISVKALQFVVTGRLNL